MILSLPTQEQKEKDKKDLGLKKNLYLYDFERKELYSHLVQRTFLELDRLRQEKKTSVLNKRSVY